jgi:hypothetical protein
VFKNKTYVYGLGVGLIAGAILLQVMLQASMDTKQYQSAPVEEMDPLQLKEQAAKYYQVFEKDTKLYTEAEFAKQLQDRVQEEKAKLVASGSAEPTKIVAVYIQPNLTATAVSEVLYRSGVIRDRQALENELYKQNATFKIQVGVHLFEGTPDLQQVINILLTKQ